MKNRKKSIRKRNNPAYDNIIKAFHSALKNHSGGFEKFASYYSRNASTVRNQFNINHENKITFDLLMEAIDYLGGEPVPMNAICHLGNGRFVADYDACDCNLDDSVMNMLASAGEIVHECAISLSDGQIDRHERESIKTKAKTLQDALDNLHSALAGDL